MTFDEGQRGAHHGFDLRARDGVRAADGLGVGTAVQAQRELDGKGEVSALADVERELIVFALKHHGGRMSRVARALGIGRSTLYRKLREYGLDDAMERQDAIAAQAIVLGELFHDH